MITYIKRLHVKKVNDSRLTVPLLLKRWCEDVKKFVSILWGEWKKQTNNIYYANQLLQTKIYLEMQPWSITDWQTCSSNELMCHRYSLRTSRRHPASSTSSSPGSSLDRAVSAEATLKLKTYRRTARLLHFAGLTGSTFEKLKQCDGKLVVFARPDRGRTWKLFQPPNEGRTCC